MNKFLRFILATSLVLFAANAFADPKVGYVEVDRILREAPQAVDEAKKLRKEFSPRTAEIERLQKEIDDKVNSGTANEQELSSLRLEFDRKQRELKEDINIRKNEELSVLQDRINKAVTAVSEAEGYDMIIYSGVAFASKRTDITDKVLKSMGKTSP